MNLGFGRQAIGIELRDGVLRAALCRRGWSGVRVVDSLAIPGVGAAPASAVAAQFAQWREGHGAGSAWVAVILPREALVCRNMVVPLPPGSALKDVVGLQLDYLHPYEDEEVLWDCQALDAAGAEQAVAVSSAPPARGEQLRKAVARVVVARGNTVRELLNWLRERGIAASQLTTAAGVEVGIALPEAQLAERTILLLSDGGHVDLLARAGAGQPARQSATLLVDPRREAAEAATQIAQGIAGLQGDVPDAFGGLLVCGSVTGGGEYWSTLKSELGKAIHVTELGEQALAEAAARVALQGAAEQGLNLLPPAERHLAPAVNLSPTCALAALVILLAALLGLRGTIRDLRHSRTLDGELEALRPHVAAVSAQQDQMSDAYKKLVQLRSIRESARVPLDVMEEVAQTLPNQAWLQQLQMDGRTATISGNAGSASEVLQAVSGAVHLESAQFLSAILRGGDGQESFRIGARLRQPLK
jgi:hypothetical protein